MACLWCLGLVFFLLAPLVRGFSEAKKWPGFPSVLLHGMGDSCYNPSMAPITNFIANKTGHSCLCLPIGDGWRQDTTNGYLVAMDQQVDALAAKVRGVEILRGGFNCIGLSQGNSICRGYIQKYNDPPVINFLSIHGPVEGVSGLPRCNPATSSFCRFVTGFLAQFAYGAMQHLLFQASYFRDPRLAHSDAYRNFSQLAAMNNEGPVVNETFKRNFGITEKFIMVRALRDTMIYPSESEWWGCYDENFASVPMREAEWYKKDSFGLRTADEANKIEFVSTPGNHLQFTLEDLASWLQRFVDPLAGVVE